LSIDFDSISHDFYQLRDFILKDLSILLESPIGGNYATALLITTACEVVGPLCYRNRGALEFFKNYLVPVVWQMVATSLYDALRNGLAHSFATKTIMQINGSSIELGVSWKEKPHFKYNRDEATIYINIPKLAEALKRALEVYESDLKTNGELRDLFRERRQKERHVNVINSDEKREWRRIITSQ